MAKIYYTYHPKTKEYVGFGYTTQDIKYSPGQEIFPANCTEIEPPTVGEGYKAVWYDTEWKIEKIIVEPEPEPEPEPDPLPPEPAPITWKDKRNAAYPPITEYLDAVVKKDKRLIEEYIQKCLAVKKRYPKE